MHKAIGVAGTTVQLRLVNCGARFTRFARRCLAVSFLCVATILLATGSNPASAANGSVTYTYDALGRVTSVSYDTGVIIIYTYDANGNRTQQVINVNTSTLTWTATTTPCTSNCWGAVVW